MFTFYICDVYGEHRIYRSQPKRKFYSLYTAAIPSSLAGIIVTAGIPTSIILFQLLYLYTVLVYSNAKHVHRTKEEDAENASRAKQVQARKSNK